MKTLSELDWNGGNVTGGKRLSALLVADPKAWNPQMDKKDQSGSENNKGSWKTWKTQICSPLHLLCYLLGSFSASILSFSFLAKEVHFSDAFEASETG